MRTVGLIKGQWSEWLDVVCKPEAPSGGMQSLAEIERRPKEKRIRGRENEK